MSGDNHCQVCKSKDIYDIIIRDDQAFYCFYIRSDFFLCKKCFLDNSVIEKIQWPPIKIFLQIRRWLDGNRDR